MSTDRRSFVQFQIEALTIHYFTNMFNLLEDEIKAFFIQNVTSIPLEKRVILYFDLAGIKSNKIELEIDNELFSLSKTKFSKEENFSIFTVNQIIKFQRKYNLIQALEFNIKSINHKTTEYKFTDCLIKLIKMRNKLAHEKSHLSFNDSDIIEVLSNDTIYNNSALWFDSLDTTLMSDESKAIFSNFLIMKHMLSELRKRVGQNDETVDS